MISEHRKEYMKRYREKHKKVIKIQQRIYHKRNYKHIVQVAKEWKKRNPEKIREISRRHNTKYRTNHPMKAKKSSREWARKNYEKIQEWRKNNPDKVKKSNKLWSDKNKERRNKLLKKRRKNDPLFRLASNLRTRTSFAFRNILNISKNKKTFEMIGLSPKEDRKSVV
jgi:hypothetical protein